MELVTDFPLFLHLDMDQLCNYKCSHCIISAPKEVNEYYDGDFLKFNDFKKLLMKVPIMGVLQLNHRVQ